jgi:hypothetical protein
MRELDYIEGKNLVIEARFAGGVYERLPALAAELVELKPNVIVADASPAITCSAKYDEYDSDCHGGHWRPGRKRLCEELGSPRRQHHRIVANVE